MRISAKNQICIIVGDPVEHSLSPKMHNRAYEELGIDDRFVFVGATVKVEDMETVVKAVRVMTIRGLTCTIPHKVEVMKYIDEIDPVARKIGAVNTVVNYRGVLKGFNTDWLGVVIPLSRMTDLAGKKVALIGAGGAARAMAYGVIEKGAVLTIFNRTKDRAEELAREIDGHDGTVMPQVRTMEQIAEVADSDIVLNATSLGMDPNEGETPVPAEFLHKGQIVFDAVYTPYKTRLLREAEANGARVIPGLEMLLYQGTAQFEYYTDKKAPEEVMRRSLMEHFGLA